MANEIDKIINAIVKLNNLTQDGKIKWRTIQPRPSLNRDKDSIVDLVYTAKYNNKRLGLYENKFKVENAPYASLSGSLDSIFGSVKYPHWQTRVVLEFIDEDGNNLWTFPEVQGLNDLLSTVKYQIAGVDEFLDSFLDEKTK